MDATYHLNGSFKPTLKRFADLEGPDFFLTLEGGNRQRTDLREDAAAIV